MSSRPASPPASSRRPIQTRDAELPSTQLSLSPEFDPPTSGQALQILASVLDAEAAAAKQHRLKKRQQAKKLAHSNRRKPPRECFVAVHAGHRS